MPWLDLTITALALAAALALRPWRGVGPGGPPWPWLAWWAVLPLFWGADRYAATPVLQPLSGAALLMLMAGWPLAVLALVPVALLTGWLGDLGWVETLQRGVWLGLVPASLAMALGAGIRRWLPQHLFVYILGRGFFATVAAGMLAGALSAALHGVPAGLRVEDVLLARWLAAWGDAFLAGMMAAIFVAFRPEWLATYADRLYLPSARP
ncbi:MAG: hypothetical protein ABT20_04045 [Rubrivivax sp. SCN 70-15]|mgnify:CR=1 FL=1|jgi:uncharacterized membrane protein|nr:MAG: hypothetical protein ABT20_04045 [Rubrivivax sp. SCN 70-15]